MLNRSQRINKSERESIKYLRNKGYIVEPLHRNKRSSHLIILVDNEVTISISSTPSDIRGLKNTVRCINIRKNRKAYYDAELEKNKCPF